MFKGIENKYTGMNPTSRMFTIWAASLITMVLSIATFCAVVFTVIPSLHNIEENTEYLRYAVEENRTAILRDQESGGEEVNSETGFGNETSSSGGAGFGSGGSSGSGD